MYDSLREPPDVEVDKPFSAFGNKIFGECSTEVPDYFEPFSIPLISTHQKDGMFTLKATPINGKEEGEPLYLACTSDTHTHGAIASLCVDGMVDVCVRLCVCVCVCSHRATRAPGQPTLPRQWRLAPADELPAVRERWEGLLSVTPRSFPPCVACHDGRVQARRQQTRPHQQSVNERSLSPLLPLFLRLVCLRRTACHMRFFVLGCFICVVRSGFLPSLLHSCVGQAGESVSQHIFTHLYIHTQRQTDRPTLRQGFSVRRENRCQ